MLDPHLAKFAESLVDAFLAFLTKHARDYHQLAEVDSSADLVPLPRAISRLLYTLCKIRGYKIITQLLSARPQHLEPMLDAFELWSSAVKDLAPGDALRSSIMVWEERYVMLLWMSHLSQVPFDLASLSTNVDTQTRDPQVRVPSLPTKCPPIVQRLIMLACEYLGVASKESEAAVRLLTGLALLQDLQGLDVHRTLITWASSELLSRTNPMKIRSDHTSLALMSFIANFSSSSSRDILDPLMGDMQRVAQRCELLCKSSAIAAKFLIKLYRSLALHCANALDDQTDLLETAVNFLMEQLGADDTGVRFAASKGLAKLATGLDHDSAMQIIEAVLEDLDNDASKSKSTLSEESLLEPGTPAYQRLKGIHMDFKEVDGRKWHGLILAVSFFILKRSMPTTQLSISAVHLVQGLNFNQKNALGNSVGTNVRDAACLGLWALARNFSTADISNALGDEHGFLQALANELIVAALLDPAGNIRRGAAAALQEMIGRHPDSIICGDGLALVQLVDYHAVASRKRAMATISVKVMTISEQYWKWLLHGLLSWRGVRFEDIASRWKMAAETRERAAEAVSYFALAMPSRMTQYKVIEILKGEIQKSVPAHVSNRHGLLWVSLFSIVAMHQ